MFWMFWFRQYFGWVLGLGVRFYDPFMVFKTVGSSRVLTSDPTLKHEVGSGQGWKILVSWSMLSDKTNLDIAHQWASNPSQPEQPWDSMQYVVCIKSKIKSKLNQTAYISVADCLWMLTLFHFQSFWQTCEQNSLHVIRQRNMKSRSLLAAWGCSLEQSSDVGHWYLSLLIHKCTHPNITNNFTNLRHQFRYKPQHSRQIGRPPWTNFKLFQARLLEFASHFKITIPLARFTSQNQRR